MKTPKKVIEKISLPLMFVTFVMAVLMFAVSPVSAEAPCDPGYFCDRDGDGWIRAHKKCELICEGDEYSYTDCDDSFYADDGSCEDVSSEGSIDYTAELISGAFVFIPGIVDVYPNSKESALLGDVPLDVYGPLNDETWDTVFVDKCPELLAPGTVYEFQADDWYISKYGGVRVMFRDFLLPYDHPDALDDDYAVITVQLVGNYFDSEVENFLPVPPPNENTANITFELTDFIIWGNTAHGVPGPRRACQLPGGGGGGGKRGDLFIHSFLEITATRTIP